MNRIVVIMLVIAMILGLSSCRLEDSYKEFFIKGISDNKNKEYFTSEEFDFARLEDVVIIPTIKEINHGKYQVFVSAYSEKGDEIVKINKVTIKSSDSDSVNYDLDGGIIFEKKDTKYEGTLEVGTFTEENIEMFDGKEFTIIVNAGLLMDDVYFSKDITYEIKVIIYQSFICPT